MQAMILAAGFGTRLLPYTKLRPKPLFPLLNEPLLLLTIKRLQNAGFDHIIVNCHYLKEQIVEALAGITGVLVQEEDCVLGTGGGLRQALPLMRDEPLLISNADIYHSIDYRVLYQSHQATEGLVTMAMHDCYRFNTVTVQGDRVLALDGRMGPRSLAFTGLHVLEPEVLEAIPDARESCILERYRQLLQAGQKVSVYSALGCTWTDMGTVADYLALHGSLLKKEIPLWSEFRTIPQDAFLIDCEVGREGVVLYDWDCVGRAQVACGVSLKRCVVWDDARIEAGTEVADRLLV